MKKENTNTNTPKELLADLQSLVAEAQTMMTDSLSEHSADAINNLRERLARSGLA